MSSSILNILATAIMSFVVGFLAGQFVDFKKVGPKEVKPEVNLRPLGERGFRMVMVAFLVAGCIFMLDFTNRQSRCNDRLIDTIQARTALNSPVDEARRANDRATIELAESIALYLETNQDPQGFGSLYQEYAETIEENNAQQRQLASQRADIPYERC